MVRPNFHFSSSYELQTFLCLGICIWLLKIQAILTIITDKMHCFHVREKTCNTFCNLHQRSATFWIQIGKNTKFLSVKSNYNLNIQSWFSPWLGLNCSGFRAGLTLTKKLYKVVKNRLSIFRTGAGSTLIFYSSGSQIFGPTTLVLLYMIMFWKQEIRVTFYLPIL